MLPLFTWTQLALVGEIVASAIPRATNPNFWFSFGDSYTTTGFNASGTLPSVGNPIGNPAYPGKTNTGGSNYIGELTAHVNRSLIFTYNYAVGGATTDTDLVPAGSDMVVQRQTFLSAAGKHPSETPWTSQNAIFSIWIGINDIGHTYDKDGDRAKFSDVLLNRDFELVDQLSTDAVSNSNTGARNFLFITVPPVNRSPLMLREDPSHQAKEKAVIETHNVKYKAKVKEYQASHENVKTWTWDSYEFFTEVLDSPKEYGFNDATSYGHAGDFWGNDYHPSSPAHVLFAKEIHELLDGTSW